MKRVPLLCVTWFLGSGLFAQQDSTHYLFEGPNRVSGMGGLLMQVGTIGLGNGVFTSMGGGGGILFDQRLMIGAYGMGLTDRTIKDDVVVNDTLREAHLRFEQGGLWLAYSFKPKRSLHPFVSMQLGWGTAAWDFDTDKDGQQEGVPPEPIEDKVFVIGPSIGAEVNIRPWFRPAVHVGYRVVSGLTLPGTEAHDADGLFFGLNLLFGGFGEK